MRVGAVEETLTVSGAAPVVDVQSTAKSEILPRDVLDSVPTGRTIQGIAQLVSGVKMDQPDVGGTHAMQQTYISGHGMAASQTTVRLDGMMLNSMCGDGQVQFYQNTAIAEEMVGKAYKSSFEIAGKQIPLPDGQWRVIAERNEPAGWIWRPMAISGRSSYYSFKVRSRRPLSWQPPISGPRQPDGEPAAIARAKTS